jgi:tRNA(His) 5'-end guanylyltransferase
MNDELGQRMKDNYEDRTRYSLPRRTHTIIRLDGKAFHTFTRNCEKPFDEKFMQLMDSTAKFLCERIQGCKFAYVQSDEISLLLTDFDDIKTDAWFNGNIQKIVSVSASMATAQFANLLPDDSDYAFFDSRVFTIPEWYEVENYFIWRQQDATRNSVQMVAQSLYSQKELHSKNLSDLQEMIFQKGQNWNNIEAGKKRGRCVIKVPRGERTGWAVVAPPVFTQERNYIKEKSFG